MKFDVINKFFIMKVKGKVNDKVAKNFMMINSNLVFPNITYFTTYLFYEISIRNGEVKLENIRNLDIEDYELETISLRLIHSVSMITAFSEYYRDRYGANSFRSKFYNNVDYVLEIGTGSERADVTKIKNFDPNSTHVGDNIKYILDKLPYLIQDYLECLSDEYDGFEYVIEGIDKIIERNRNCSDNYLDINTHLALFIDDNLELFNDYL